MSHLATIQTEIKDIRAVKAACAELGWTFNENKTAHTIWCDNPAEWDTKEAPCAHSITCPEWTWGDGSTNFKKLKLEVGLIQTATGYALSYDNMIERKGLGEKAGRFIQMYGVHKATIHAKSMGYAIKRTTGKNGVIKLTVSGM